VSASRVGRLFKLGRLAGGVAATALNQGARQLARGQMPVAAELLLNPENARRFTLQLSEMRGAVMKVGQLLSMEAGDLLPRELTDILAGLRDSAHTMPDFQLQQVLNGAWGSDWPCRFESFDLKPFAAASIGQVHKAVDLQGRRLAVKIQYPGVSASIDSDVDNVAGLLKLFRLLPPGFDIQPLLEVARQQLHDEADYCLEACHLRRYRGQLAQDPVFRMPEVIDDLSSEKVLAMTLIEGEGIESLASAPAAVRDQMAARIIDLALKEFLHWGMVQSDPNFANFLFDARDNTIGLVDFGALRINRSDRAQSFARLLTSALNGDLEDIVDAACEVGYVEASDSFNVRVAIADLVQTAAEPAVHAGRYDFGYSSLSQRLGEKLWYLRNQEAFQRVPPADVIFLHRKLAGVYLLCARINARVDVRACVLEALALKATADRALT